MQPTVSAQLLPPLCQPCQRRCGSHHMPSAREECRGDRGAVGELPQQAHNTERLCMVRACMLADPTLPSPSVSGPPSNWATCCAHHSGAALT